MKERLIKFLKVIRLLDEQNEISLTNAILISAITLVHTGDGQSLMESVVLALAIVNYAAKRYLQPKSIDLGVDASKKMDDLKSRLSRLEMKSGLETWRQE